MVTYGFEVCSNKRIFECIICYKKSSQNTRAEDDTGQRNFVMPTHSIIFCFHPGWSKSPAESVGRRWLRCNSFRLSKLRKVGCNILSTQLHVPSMGCCRTSSRNATQSSGLSNQRSKHLSASPKYLKLVVHVT